MYLHWPLCYSKLLQLNVFAVWQITPTLTQAACLQLHLPLQGVTAVGMIASSANHHSHTGMVTCTRAWPAVVAGRPAVQYGRPHQCL